MYKTILLFILLLIINKTLTAQNNLLAGHWEGAMSRLGSVQLLKFDFIETGDSLEIQYDDPAKGVFRAFLDDEKKIGKYDSAFTINFGYGKFNCVLNKKYLQITGSNKKWNPEVLFHIKKTGTREEDPFTFENISIINDNIKLAGTIYKPKTKGAYPMVVLLHGSDVQTRRTWYIRSLIYVLTKNGIGITVYDKRGTGESGGNMNTASFQDFANDAVACLNYLSQRKDIPVSKFGLFATSAGGWVASIVANKWKRLNFTILNVGPAVSTYEQEMNRVEFTLRQDGVDEKKIDSALQHTKLYFDAVKTNSSWAALKKSVDIFKTKDWAKDVLQLPVAMNDTDMIWWRSHYFDPQNELSNIKCSVLSIMGENDNLVPPAVNKPLMEKYLKRSGTKYKIIILPNAGHSGISFQTLLGGEWKWPEHFWIWPKRPEMYYNEIIKWIKNKS